MEPFRFTCPHCNSLLRLREKMFVGRQVHCPECANALVIIQGSHGLAVEKITVSAPNRASDLRNHPVSDLSPPQAGRRGKLLDAPVVGIPPAIPWWKTPRVIAWGVAGGCALIAATFVIATSRPGSRSSSAAVESPPAVAESATDAADTSDPPEDVPALTPPGDTKHAESGKPPVQAPLRSDGEHKLLRIGHSLIAYREHHGHFPAGTESAPRLAPPERLSWMALLASESGAQPAPPIVRERAWQDRLNDAFVRRRLHEFQNLAVPQLTGADGYPASHFAGISGVGPDAQRLPLPHPRAGIFGDSRQTRLKDITDGTSQTMMVAGVHNQLGSWAAGGTPTMRSLTRQPYVNGPDGLGTGQPASMFVLMADGSVRSIAADMDPRLLRRMAAMADGLPLDSAVEGDPGDEPSVALAGGKPAAAQKGSEKPLMTLPGHGSPVPAGAATSKQTPVSPGTEETPRPEKVAAATPGADSPAAQAAKPERTPVPAKQVNLSVSLGQKLLKFERPKPAPLIDVLHEMAEMAGTTITYDAEELDSAAALLQRPAPGLRLEKVTLADILEKLLHPAGLTFRIDNDQIRIILRPAPKPTSASK